MQEEIEMNAIKSLKFTGLIWGIIMTIGALSHLYADHPLWRPETNLEVKLVNDVDISPDGKEVVYSITEALIDENKYQTQIWKGGTANPKSHSPITDAKTPSSLPRWSPNGKWIAFTSKKSGVKNLYLLSSDGTKEVQITNLPRSVIFFHWSPDSKKIAFVAPKEKDHEELRDNLSLEVEKYSGSGDMAHLWVIDAQPDLQQPVLLTDENYHVIGEGEFHSIIDAFDWSPDSQAIAFTYTVKPGSDERLKASQIAFVDLSTKEISHLPKLAPHQSVPKFSPDGTKLAFLKSDEKASWTLVRYLTVYHLATGEFQQLSKTPDEASFLMGPSLLGWSHDGQNLLYLEPFRTKFAIWQVPLNGGPVARFDDGKRMLSSPLLSRNRKWIGAVLETSVEAPEAYFTSSFSFQSQKVSQANIHLAKKPIASTEVIQWTSSDHKEIEGLLTYPKNYVKGQRYPLLLFIHGGPMGVFSESYLGTGHVYPLASFADAGFLVLRVNPRGSAGYGREFRHSVCEDWGGRDYDDLMTGISCKYRAFLSSLEMHKV